MQVKTGIRILIWLMAAILLVWGCSKGPEITDETVEKEIRHAWKSIHGKSGQKGYRWKLDGIRIMKRTYNDKCDKVKVKVFFKYRDATNKQLERNLPFTFLLKGKTWQLEDRNARSMSSTTRYNITP